MSIRTAPTSGVGEDAHDAAAALDLLVDSLERLVDQILRQWDLGKPVNASTSALAWSISGPTLGNEANRLVGDKYPEVATQVAYRGNEAIDATAVAPEDQTRGHPVVLSHAGRQVGVC